MQFVAGLLDLICAMALELKRADRLDDQTLARMEQRAFRKLKAQAFDDNAEQLRLVNISRDAVRFALALVKTDRDNDTLCKNRRIVKRPQARG